MQKFINVRRGRRPGIVVMSEEGFTSLQGTVEKEKYDAAMKQYLSRSVRPLREKVEEYPSRDGLHDREVLRRYKYPSLFS